jgi:hypothetical protein
MDLIDDFIIFKYDNWCFIVFYLIRNCIIHLLLKLYVLLSPDFTYYCYDSNGDSISNPMTDSILWKGSGCVGNLKFN